MQTMEFAFVSSIVKQNESIGQVPLNPNIGTDYKRDYI